MLLTFYRNKHMQVNRYMCTVKPDQYGMDNVISQF